MTYMTLLNGVKMGIIRFAELKFGQKKWRKDEFGVGLNDVNRNITELHLRQDWLRIRCENRTEKNVRSFMLGGISFAKHLRKV